MTEKCCRCGIWTPSTINPEHMTHIQGELSLPGPICTDCIGELFADLGPNEWDNMIWNFFQDIVEMQKVHEREVRDLETERVGMQKVHEREVRDLETERDELLVHVRDLEDGLFSRPEPEEPNNSMSQEFFST